MASFYLIGGHDFDLKNNYIAKQLLKLSKKDKPHILLFPTAMEDNEKAITNFKKEYEELNYTLDILFLTKEVNIDKINNLVNKSDILYFTGGNTSYILDFIKKNNLEELFKSFAKQDKIIAGVSAGAIIWCKEGLTDYSSYKDNNNFYNYKILKGLGVIPISFCPHFNEGDRILYFKNYITESIAYALDNNTAIFINDNKISYYSLNKYHLYLFRKENNYTMEYIKKEKLAVLGPKGTFSETAAIKYQELNNKEYDLEFYQSIQKTAEGINETNIGILPFENTIDGYVQETLDMLNKYNYTIETEIKVPVNFIFLSKALNIKDVKKVYVQFKAKGQCLKFINDNNLEVVETESNITSYDKLKNSGPTYGAIVPSHVKASDFPLIINDVCDSFNNYTRFLVLKKDSKIDLAKSSFKVSLILNASVDTPGILMDALMVFKKSNINLSAIMSRPTKEELGKYYFYIEFNFTDDHSHLEEIVEEINKMGKFKIKVLGYYKTEGEEEKC